MTNVTPKKLKEEPESDVKQTIHLELFDILLRKDRKVAVVSVKDRTTDLPKTNFATFNVELIDTETLDKKLFDDYNIHADVTISAPPYIQVSELAKLKKTITAAQKVLNFIEENKELFIAHMTQG